MAESQNPQDLKRLALKHERAGARVEALKKDIERAEVMIQQGNKDEGLELLHSVLDEITEEMALAGSPVAQAINAVRKDR